MSEMYHQGLKVYPETRGDCLEEKADRANGDRCVMRHCRHFIDTSTGCADSCTLDIIDREGECSDEIIGQVCGVMPGRVPQLAQDLERQVFERALVGASANSWLSIIADTLSDDVAEQALARAVGALKADGRRAQERARDKCTLPLFGEAS